MLFRSYLALVHPGCSIVPAALAMAERERAGGTALLRAMVLGYDLCARTSQALGLERFRSRGHSTHSFGGIFGSAAAAGAIARAHPRSRRRCRGTRLVQPRLCTVGLKERPARSQAPIKSGSINSAD